MNSRRLWVRFPKAHEGKSPQSSEGKGEPKEVGQLAVAKVWGVHKKGGRSLDVRELNIPENWSLKGKGEKLMATRDSLRRGAPLNISREPENRERFGRGKGESIGRGGGKESLSRQERI